MVVAPVEVLDNDVITNDTVIEYSLTLGADCHVVVPEGTTVTTLESIRLAMAEAGCGVKSWWSTVDIPFLGDEVADTQ